MITRAGLNWISVAGPDVLGRDVGAVLGAQQVLEQDLEAERQVGRPGHRVETVDLEAAPARRQRAASSEAVRCHDRVLP
jgi:hypothetical protein